MKRKSNKLKKDSRKSEIRIKMWLNALEKICELTGQKFELKRETLMGLMEKSYCLVIDKKSEYFGRVGIEHGTYEYHDSRLWHQIYFKGKREPVILNDKQFDGYRNLPHLLEKQQKLYDGEQQEFNFNQQ